MKNKKEYVTKVFDEIAQDYDKMNNILTFGLFPYWQNSLIKKMNLQGDEKVLDICCGTGEMAVKINKVLLNKGGGSVTGIDLSDNMLEIARKKSEDQGVKITFDKQDALRLQFPDNSFSCAVNAFALRNVSDISGALKEMHRILEQNGKAYVIEITKPSNPVVRFFFSLYYFRIVPMIGRIADKGIKTDGLYTPYEWLSQSLRLFPDKESIIQIFYRAGFQNVSICTYGAGAIVLYIANK